MNNISFPKLGLDFNVDPLKAVARLLYEESIGTE